MNMFVKQPLSDQRINDYLNTDYGVKALTGKSYLILDNNV